MAAPWRAQASGLQSSSVPELCPSDVLHLYTHTFQRILTHGNYVPLAVLKGSLPYLRHGPATVRYMPSMPVAVRILMLPLFDLT